MSGPLSHRLVPGETVDLQELPTAGEGDRDAFEAELKTLRDRMDDWQRALYAERRRSLLVIFQALDGGGKDSSIRKVFRGVNPQGVRVASFKKPTELERQHDFLWRIHQQTPAAGMIAVFNRSHYEDVLVVRVDEIVPEPMGGAHRDPKAAANALGTAIGEELDMLGRYAPHELKRLREERFLTLAS